MPTRATSRILLKLENLQPSGSFKSRGLGNLILSHVAEHQRSGTDKLLHFFSSSGGNAGLAAVTAARALGYDVSVIVPTSTEPLMVEKIRAAGATDVVQKGASWYHADQYLREVVLPAMKEKGEDPIYIPPFNHPAIWQGVGTMIEEIQRQMPDDARPDAIVCSVGGGGLFCGVMHGLDGVGWSDVPVLAIETVGADSLSQSLKAGELVTLPQITSIALSLGAVKVAPRALEQAQRSNVQSLVLSDAEAAMGTCRFADDERILVEAACGVSIAPCYNGLLEQVCPGLRPESQVVVIVCGGTRITPELVSEYRNTYGLHQTPGA